MTKEKKMEKIIERTKFAIAWQKTNKDQDREEHNDRLNPAGGIVIIRIRYHHG